MQLPLCLVFVLLQPEHLGLTGSHRPETAESVLDGIDIASYNWTAQVFDCVSQDVGAITSVTLTLTNPGCNTNCIGCGGSATAGTQTFTFSGSASITDNSCSSSTAATVSFTPVIVPPVRTVVWNGPGAVNVVGNTYSPSTATPGTFVYNVKTQCDGLDCIPCTNGTCGTSSSQTVTVTVQAISNIPVINSPLCPGSTSISGTSSEANGTIIAVIKNGSPAGNATVAGGTWTFNATALVCGDSYTATAMAPGECVSPVSAATVVTDAVKPTLTVPTTDLALGCNPTLPTTASVITASSATDNCGVPTITVVAGSIGGSCSKSQTFTVTATDGCGNTDVKTVTYTWRQDLVLPVISTTAVSGDLGCNPMVTAPVFTGSDNCDGVFTPTVTTSGPSGPVCARTQTWTANYTDQCGNAATPVSVTYTWKQDQVLPVISTTAVSGDLGCNPMVTAPVFTGSDNCDGVFTPTVTTSGPSGPVCARTQTWTANYTDQCGNAATPVSVTYTWKQDLVLPVISTAAVSGDLGCNPTMTAPVFTGSDNCDGVFTPIVTTSGPSGPVCARTQTWTANYTDQCGNAATPVSVTYTWKQDQVLPVISTTAVSGDLGCNPMVTAPVFTGSDNCDGVFTPTVTTSGPSGPVCARTQTWTANYTDQCSNAATPVSITYTWKQDLVLPVISTAAVSGDLGCNPTVTAPAFTGSDNCDGIFTPTVTTSGPSGPVCARTQTWTANYTDQCGNAATPVSVTYTWKQDQVLPVISTTAVSGDLGCNPTMSAPAFTGSDNCDGVFTPTVTTSGPSGPVCARTQTWTANYTDQCGNAATPVSVTFTWKEDQVLPVISTTAVSGDLGCNPMVTTPDFSGFDNCDGIFSPFVTTGGPVNTTGCLYTQTWTANYADQCGNSATPVNITYTWKQDLVLPVISTTAVSGDLGCNPMVTVPGFSGFDNCDGIFYPFVTTGGPVNISGCLYTQTWTANYADQCGNSATPVNITYTWKQDLALPVISTTAVSGDLGCNPMVTAPNFTGSDNCDGAFLPIVTTIGPTGPACSRTQTWIANHTDACNNLATQVSIQYTWVEDMTAPVIAVATSADPAGACNPGPITPPTFTLTEACTPAKIDVVDSGVQGTGCAKMQTWTANFTDGCGNAADEVVVTYTWTVDAIKPVIATTAVSENKGCNSTIVAPVFTLTEACSPGTIVVVDGGVTGAGCEKSQIWTANFTDGCGNVADEVVVTYTWTVDAIKPVIATTAVSENKGCNPTIVAPVFTLTEACSPGTIVVVDGGVTGAGCEKSQIWTANFTDGCGNVADEVVVTYTWTVDAIKPVIATTAVSENKGCNPTIVAPVFTLTEACSPGTIVVVDGGVTGAGCEKSQIWTANFTDGCGNVADEVVVTYTWTVDAIKTSYCYNCRKRKQRL
ncbi:MAG: hypothetical protein IPL08_19635 [Saprospiraceae bacterium]|nr:hypothetical protein [Saprospiraceae bacterium]